jgi:protocatechuate 3,4-dioxygenase beta subunit
VPAGTCTIRARATGYQEGWAGNVQVDEGAIKEGVEIRLQKSVKLVGRVTAGGTGRAVPDASVSVLAAESGGGPRSTMSGGAGLVTDADGRFEAESLPGKYRVEVTHPSYATASQNAEVTQQGGSVEIKLGKGGVLGGMVIADDRKPVTDAEVSLRELGDSGRGGLFAGGNSTGTDATGRFRFENLSPGRYRATAARRESSSEPVETVVDVSTVKEDLVLTLASGATIRGLVSGVAESEKARIGVVAQGPSDFFASALTDSQGQFEIRGAPEGVIRLSATLGSFMSGSQNSTAQVTITAGQKEVPAEIVFKNEASLSGRVLRNGQGVAGVTVMASPAVGGRLSAGSARTDDQGNYRIEGLDNGECNVSVMTGFGGGGSKSEKVNISGETQHDFVLPTARVTGEVLESGTRQPLSNVSIVATVAAGTDSAGRMLPRGVSDSSGRFTLEGLEPGRYSIRAERQGYQADKREIEASVDNATPVTIEMVRGQGLALEVRDGIYNIPLRSVMVRAEDSSARSSYVGQVSLDQEGRGEISSLQPGTYKIWVASSGYALSGIAVSVPGPAAAVRLTPGGRIIVNAGPKTLALPSPRYKLLMASGEPMPSVYGSGDTWRRLFSGLEMENIPPGSYTFVIDGGETKSVNVTEGGLTVVDVP